MSFRDEDGWFDAPTVDIAAALVGVGQAVALAPDLPFSQCPLGRLYTRSYSQELDKALANALVFHRRGDDVVPLIDVATAPNPVPPY